MKYLQQINNIFSEVSRWIINDCWFRS